MPRAKRPPTTLPTARFNPHAEVEHGASDESAAVGTFLRRLAERAERDPGFAAQVGTALRESGLLAHIAGAGGGVARGKKPRTTPSAAHANDASEASAPAAAPPDPFVLLREQGEAGLRSTLEALDLQTLRALVRTSRLDPARISARWNARERVIALIVSQVLARANHGKAFSHV